MDPSRFVPNSGAGSSSQTQPSLGGPSHSSANRPSLNASSSASSFSTAQNMHRLPVQQKAAPPPGIPAQSNTNTSTNPYSKPLDSRTHKVNPNSNISSSNPIMTSNPLAGPSRHTSHGSAGPSSPPRPPGRARSRDTPDRASSGGNSSNTNNREKTSINDGKGGSGINRVNRACNNCRRMKMRCVYDLIDDGGKESKSGYPKTPCKRCQHTGQVCVMEKPTKSTSGGAAGEAAAAAAAAMANTVGENGGGPSSGRSGKNEKGDWPAKLAHVAAKAGNHSGSGTAAPTSATSAGGGVVIVEGVGDDRIRSLESQVSLIHNTLAELVSTIKSASTPSIHRGHSSASPSSLQMNTSTGSHSHSHSNHPSDPPMAHISPESSNYSPATGIHGTALGSMLFRDGQPGGGGMGMPPAFDPAQRVLDLIAGPPRDPNNHNHNTMNSSFDPYRHRNSQPSFTRTGIPLSANDARVGSISGASVSSGEEARFGHPQNQSFGTSNTRGSAGYEPSLGPSYPVTADLIKNGSNASVMSPEIDLNVLMTPSESGTALAAARFLNPTTPSVSGLTGLLPVQQNSNKRVRSHNVSANLSPGGSDVEGEDPLDPSQIMDPLGSMSSMAGLAEAAVERARAERLAMGKDESKETVLASLQTLAAEANESGRPSKRPRLDDHGFAIPDQPPHRNQSGVDFSDYPASLLGTTSRPVSTDVVRTNKGKQTRRHIHAFPDVIALGIVQEREARELFDLYFSGSNNFMPVFDPEVDTWDSLRVRSPFSVSSIVAVGARVRDGGRPMSETQRLALDHSRRIAIGTVFAAVARVEAVQAMCLISAFNENGWLPSGHAVRMAIDMGLNKCFGKLVASGMGVGKSRQQLEEERDLVIGARVWFCLYVLEHQMSFGCGRDPVIRENETIAQARRFLDHPLSIMSDVRLISTVEGIALRSPLHFLLTSSPEEPVDQDIVARLQQANLDSDKWLEYWDQAMNEKFGKDPTDFYRESLRAQREYSSLFLNSQLLRGIRDAADVQKLPADKRELAIQAMRNAQACLEITIRGKNYRRGLRFAVHYTHVCAAFAASFLIRIARLFPKELDLRKTAKDVEELASILSEVPAGRYARSLRLILRRARKQKFIPPASVPTSPNRLHANLPLPESRQGPFPSPSTNTQSSTMLHQGMPGISPVLAHTSPGMLINNALSQKHESPGSNPEAYEYDFSFAQELINRANEAGINLGQDQQMPLFLNGESLGNADAANPSFSLENYFLPPDLDLRFGDLSALNSTEALQNLPSWPTDPNDLPPDMWW